MQKVKNGDTVLIRFTGRLADRSVPGRQVGDAVLELRVGDAAVLPGLHHALLGMCPGESKNALIPAAEAFGPRRQELVMRLDSTSLPEDVHPEVGAVVQLQSDRGDQVFARVVEVSDEDIILDANHPLAGRDLSVHVELLRIGPTATLN